MHTIPCLSTNNELKPTTHPAEFWLAATALHDSSGLSISRLNAYERRIAL